jgi:putative Holliday junction resolvase
MPEQARRTAARTVLAFDFGLRRIGVAVGEAELGSAHPLPVLTVPTPPVAFNAIEALVKEWKPALLLVGRPLGEDGAPQEMTRRAERFARQLNGRFHLPVELVDERYSSTEAQSRLRAAVGARQAVKLARGKMLDSQAAKLLLEQFFNDQHDEHDKHDPQAS